MNDDLPSWHQAHEVRLIKEPVRVDVDWIGEGYEGDYDSEDPDDRPLYRFDVFVRTPGTDPGDDQWDEVANSSYCTNMDTSLPLMAVEAFAQYIMDEVYEPVCSDRSIKRLCEELSNTPADAFDHVVAAATATQMDEQTPSAPASDRSGPRI